MNGWQLQHLSVMLLLSILFRIAVKKLKIERSEDANAGKFKAIMEKGRYVRLLYK